MWHAGWDSGAEKRISGKNEGNLNKVWTSVRNVLTLFH